MPWEKQFDVEQALDRAVETFWSRGYEATSMQQLLDSMGLNRGSFYDTYGGKREVLLQALRRYGETVMRPAFADACRTTSPRAAVEGVFAWLLAEAQGEQGRRGCFYANCALELSAGDEEVAEIVRAGFDETETFFRSSIEQAQTIGEISGDVDPAAAASVLLGLVLGLRVLARGGARRERLEAIVRQASALLDG